MSDYKYEMHISGPDEIITFNHEIRALRMANGINKRYLKDRSEHPDNEVLYIATVKRVPKEQSHGKTTEEN